MRDFTQIGLGLAVVVFGFIFALGDFIPTQRYILTLKSVDCFTVCIRVGLACISCSNFIFHTES